MGERNKHCSRIPNQVKKKEEKKKNSSFSVCFVLSVSCRRLKNHQICVRKGKKSIVVNVIDTCADSDCSGCCTRNKGDKNALIDLEHFTNMRFGVADGNVRWADLGKIPEIC